MGAGDSPRVSQGGHLKQMGENVDNSAQPDGGLCSAAWTGKGDDPSDWPEDLQVQEFPFQVMSVL